MEKRLEAIRNRMALIDKNRSRILYSVPEDIAIGQASTGPAVGRREGLQSAVKNGGGGKFVMLGDQSVVVRNGRPFPGKVPSSTEGIKFSLSQFTEDFVAFMDGSPAEIYPGEEIAGEIHWEFPDVRLRIFPENGELEQLTDNAMAAGSVGFPVTHTCADLSIGIREGWTGILDRIISSRERFLSNGGKGKEAEYLKTAELTCGAVIRFIRRHGEKALELASKETHRDQQLRYKAAAVRCFNLANGAPKSFAEGIQFVWFFIMAERMQLGGNGYGRIDQYLLDLYRKDISKGTISREDAKNLIIELYLKYPTFYSLGGRRREGADAVNELSWLFLEAYDQIGGANEFGIMWHKDIDRNFFTYACDVLLRHGTGSPALINQDVLAESETAYGVELEDAWNVAYSGCFWYCIPGKEWCAHDTLAVSGVKCLANALNRAFVKGLNSVDELLDLLEEEMHKAVKALQEMTDWQLRRIPSVWPETVTSLMCHGCIESGRDITDAGGKYNSLVVQFSGIGTVADSLSAIDARIFREKSVSLQELKQALDSDYCGHEDIRMLMLTAPKYGNDQPEADRYAVEAADMFRSVLSEYTTCKGTCYRPAFFSWAGHAYGSLVVGATPDGRCADDPVSQGPNPSHGCNKSGITATASSVAKLDFRRNAGGPLHLELDPGIKRLETPDVFLAEFAETHFMFGGQHIFANVVSLEDLEAAVESPEKYEHLVIRVTGFSVHFVQLDKKIQREIIKRTRHQF